MLRIAMKPGLSTRPVDNTADWRRTFGEVLKPESEVPQSETACDAADIACPKCAQDVSVSIDTLGAGSAVDCPHCGATFDFSATGHSLKFVDEALTHAKQ